MASNQLERMKKHFEANMLDGDAVQGGQMLSSEFVLEYIQEHYLSREAVEEAIGEDEPLLDADPRHPKNIKAQTRNKFRAELRNKLLKGESE